MSRYFNDFYEEDFVAHHGILGMKWGIRRYQNADGSLTSAGKRRYKIQTNSDGTTILVKKKRLTFKQKRNLKKAREAATAKRASEKQKEHLVNYGTATEVSQHLNELTNDQKQRAINRLNLDSQIITLSDKEKARQKSKVDKFLDTGDKLARGIGTTVKIVGAIRTLRNWMNDDDEDDSASIKKEKPSKSEKKVKSSPSPKVDTFNGESNSRSFRSERSKGPDDIEVEDAPKRERSGSDQRKHYDDIIDSFAFEYPDYNTRLSSDSQKVLDSVLALPGPTNLLEDKHK